ncbi:MAG: hypothetical protein WAW17_25950, partial [Rhodococcus sp. (in: high G+C Gram-positive bacteria)]|uniref:hypothetical protein n=1 Tax=Rhodococcus sp. TaxID=1831 RepID=UPI003BB1A7F6
LLLPPAPAACRLPLPPAPLPPAGTSYEKRYQEVTAPVSADIGKALDEFARQRGFTITFDLNKLAPAILTISPTIDVTQAFIADFNSKYPATSPQ